MNVPLLPDAPAVERLPHILERLREAHPDAHCALDYQEPWQLLVATILSAQCTDERVNMVTPVLFTRYPDVAALAGAARQEVEEIIYSTGFYRAKARYLQETAHKIVHEHGGEIPADMQALRQFPGVARKTANVVLGEIFGIAEGVVVDTHVKRLANRLGLASSNNPEKVEQELMALVPHENWIELSHLLVFHGRRICHARRPDCPNCPVNHLCPSAALYMGT